MRSAAQARADLIRELERCAREKSADSRVASLLRAGEMECGVSDDGSVSIEPWQELTDFIADALVACPVAFDCRLIANLREAALPENIALSPPEGFAYYALHPLAYAGALDSVPQLNHSVAVIGIRTIGATLSAVVAAAARARGKTAERITVRPHGHPYNRCTTFSLAEADFVRRHAARGSSFLVVDEGPGLSGSSFLSVAEALERVGVAVSRISLLCSHAPNVNDLRADNAAARAQRFRWIAASSDVRRPRDAHEFIGGGEWRKKLFLQPADFPASWVSYERLKYLSPAEAGPRRLFKFIGFGHYGQAVLAREMELADAGFAPMVARESDGFVSYPWVTGSPMSAADLSEHSIRRMAEYCAFRAGAFRANNADIGTLQRMAEHNLEQLDLSMPLRLTLQRPVIVDGCMQPHEWLRGDDGQMLKTDGGSHGDDHFFPGPTDIAWDLAGAIVEWRMSPAAREFLLSSYRRASGDLIERRINEFIVAYAIFRSAWCLMAANALAGSEQSRLLLTAELYQRVLSRLKRDSLLV